MAPRPHPSRHGFETADSQPVPRTKDVWRNVRRRDRGQRSTATKDPNTKRLRRYVNFPTRANGTMTFPVSGHQPCVRYNFLTVCPIPDPHHVSGTIASTCVRHRTTTLFPITPTRTKLIQNQSTCEDVRICTLTAFSQSHRPPEPTHLNMHPQIYPPRRR